MQPKAAWSSLRPRPWRLKRRCKNVELTWNTCTDRQQPKRRVDLRLLRWMLFFLMISLSTFLSIGHLDLRSPFNEPWNCTWNHARRPSRTQVETGPKQGMDVDEFGGDRMMRSSPSPKNESKLNFDELLQAQARGESEKLAELRAQMARDFVSPVPKKRPKHG